MQYERIKIEDIETVVNKVPNNKAPGIDGIPYEFYKKHKKKMVQVLEEIYKEAENKRKIFKSYEKNYLILLQKKEDKKYQENHRPLTLINVYSKMLSSILLEKI